MEIKQLEYFMQLCRDKTFARAADNLFLTHQGLNKAIRSLEEELGVSLYWKDKRKIVLTEAGEELSRQAKVILKNVSSLRQNMSVFSEKGKSKLIQIACAYAVYGKLFPLFFSGLRETFGQIQFDFNEYPDLICEKAVLEEGADIAFTIGPFNNDNLLAVPLIENDLCVLVSNQHPLAKRPKLNCTDLRNEKILIANKDFKIYHTFLEQCRLAGVDPDIIFTGSEISSIHSLGGANTGVAVTVNSLSHHPGCQTIPFEPGVLNWTICMVTLKQRAGDHSIRQVTDYIKRIARENEYPNKVFN